MTAAVLASLFGDGHVRPARAVKMKLLGQRAAVDRFPGYPVVRAWFPGKRCRLRCRTGLKPDVAVVQCHKSVPLGKALEAAGVPIVVYLRNVEFHELDGDLAELKLGALHRQFASSRRAPISGRSASNRPSSRRSIDRESYAH